MSDDAAAGPAAAPAGPSHGILWRIGTHIPLLSSLLAVMDTQHALPGAAPIDPLDPAHRGTLGKRFFRSSTTGLLVHYRSWTPSPSSSSSPPLGVVYIVHGFGEYCGRYEHVALALTSAGFLVHSLDHQGCGESEGDRAYVERFQHYVADVLQLATHVAPPPPASSASSKQLLPRFLVGHSMGGLISLHTVHTAPSLFSGLVLSGPQLAVDPRLDTSLNRFLARTFSSILPKMQVDKIDASTINSDKGMVAQYERDPLVYHGGVRVRVGHELLNAMDGVRTWAGDLTLPLLVVHGENDILCGIEGSRWLVSEDGAKNIKDKTLRTYPGLCHEVFQEAKGPEIIAEVANWLVQHAKAAE